MHLAKLVMAAALAVSLPALSASVSKKELDACSSMSSLGRTIMEARQAGMPMSEMMDVLSQPGRLDDGERSKTLVEWAFDEPRYSTEDAKERVIRDFENEVYRACYKNAKERSQQK